MGTDRLLLILAGILVALGLVALLSGGESGEPALDPAAGGAGEHGSGGALEGREAPPPKEGGWELPEPKNKQETIRNAMLKRLPVEEQKRFFDRVTIRGIVVDANGDPAANVNVYQLESHQAQGTPGGWRTPRTKTNGAGRFTLSALKPLADTMIVASRFGGAPGYISGADIGPGHTVRLVLPSPTTLDVHLVDTDGKPVRDEGVRAVPMTWRGRRLALPGPEAPIPEQFLTTNAEGRARFTFPRSTPLMVVPESEGFVANPNQRWLPDSEGSVTFVLQKGITILVTALDAESGKRLEQAVWVNVLERDSGRELAGGSSDADDGVFRGELALLPGYFDVMVTMRDREPLLLPNVHANAAGDVVELTARMSPLKPAATLALALPAIQTERAGDPVPKRREVYAPVVLLRREDGDWGRHGWQRRVDGKLRKGNDNVLELPVRPGRYEVIVADLNTGRCATKSGIVVEGPAGAPLRLGFVPGTVVSLYEVLPPEIRVRDLRVEIAGGAEIAAYGFDPLMHGSLRSQGTLVNAVASANSPIRRGSTKGPQLGPYPGGSATLVVTDWEGATHRYPVRRR